MYNFLTVFDFILLPFYLTIIGLIANYTKRKMKERNPIYKYYTLGLFVKIFGAVAVCLIYTYYYTTGGDTTGYFMSARALSNVLLKDPKAYLSIMMNHRTSDLYSVFDSTTGYPWYWKDTNAFSVVRFTSIFMFFGGFKYMLTSVLVACATFSGVWRIFLIFSAELPRRTNLFAWAILFMPSVVFWGSGIMKDSFVLAAIGWFIYSVYRMINGGNKYRYTFTLLVAFYVLISIKPFVFYGMGVGLGLWAMFSIMPRIKNMLIRIVAYPVVIIGIAGAGAGGFAIASSMAGGYYSSMDGMLKRAVVIQDDLTRDYYGDNSFDIGEFEPTIPGIASKFPAATIAGLFRPFLWESRSVVMLFSGLENMILLSVTLFILIRVGPVFFLRNAFSAPYIVTFSIMFSIFFAFSIGLVTANFGALVRYKIPVLPFYGSALIVMFDKYMLRRGNRLAVPEDFQRTNLM